MNELLWLLYLADVVHGVSIVLAIAGIVVLIASCFYFLYHVIEPDGEFPPPRIKTLLAWVVGIFMLSAILPTKQLILIAAGLRAGQQALETPLAQKALRLLDKRLEDALKEVEK